MQKGSTIVSVHRTISNTVLRRFVAARARTALAESVGSEDVSGAAATIPDVTATNREGCVATCDFSVSGRDPHPQSRPCRHRNDGDYERCAWGHVPGGSGQFKSGWSRGGKKHEWNHGHWIYKNRSCGIKEAGGDLTDDDK